MFLELTISYNNLSKIRKLEKKYFNIYHKLNQVNKVLNIDLFLALKKIDSLKDVFNQKFIEEEKEKYDFLFNNVSGYSLDEKQKEAIIKDPDNLLIVAGAGSGKTLTLIGQVMYLLYKGVKKESILCLSFTNESANNLRNALLKNNIDLEVMTFHKLGLDILKNNGYNCSICKDNLLIDIIKEYSGELAFFIKDDLITIDENGNKVNQNKKIIHNIAENSEQVKMMEKVVMTFINLYKGNGYNINCFKTIYRKISKEDKTLKKRNIKLINFCEKIYLKYEEKLKILNKIDFNDMIIRATKVKNIKNYDYILVDEFQDTSKTKCELLLKIQKHTNAKIIAVGDDWQSIYQFTGCTLENFVNFDKVFKNSEIVFIENTYRNSKELLKLTSDFITKNSFQLKKKLKSNLVNTKPVKIYYYEHNYKEVIGKVLKSIKGKEVLILARNNKDVDDCKKFLNNSKIKIMTVHKSKGLESDNVIVINLEDNPLGFPNKTINDPILKYVLPKEEAFLYAEERRLFYVALTRTKNNVYLLVKKNNPSVFIKELLKNCFNYIEVLNDILTCPLCGQKLIKRNGKYGEFYGCKGYPKCNYTKCE